MSSVVEETSTAPTSLKSYLLRLSILCHRSVLLPLCLGQMLSILICGTGISSEYLAGSFQVHLPILQNFLNYLLLALVFGLRAIKNVAIGQECRTESSPYQPHYSKPLSRPVTSSAIILNFMRTRGWKYIVASVVDVEANYLMVKAYQYTSVTSIMLLDCLTIPTALILSYVLLRVRYRWTHYAGVLSCLTGVVIMFIGDLSTKGNTTTLNPLLGNILVIAGSIAYGFSNVWQEHLIRTHSLSDFLGFVGIFGALLSGVQSVVVEWDAMLLLPHLSSQHGVLLWVAAFSYALCMFLFYTITPVVMRATSAVLVNLSLTSSDVYALLMGVFLFHYQFQYLYFVGYIFIVIGVVGYVLRSPIYLTTSEDATEINDLAEQTPCTSGQSPA